MNRRRCIVNVYQAYINLAYTLYEIPTEFVFLLKYILLKYSQRFWKLIYLHLPTDYIMKVSLQSTGLCMMKNLHETVRRQKQIN